MKSNLTNNTTSQVAYFVETLIKIRQADLKKKTLLCNGLFGIMALTGNKIDAVTF